MKTRFDIKYNKINKHMDNLIKISHELYGIKKKKMKIPCLYNLNSSRRLGEFNSINGDSFFRFNKKLIDHTGEKRYLPIVTHEFAHLLVHLLYTLKGVKVSHHGIEWQNIMYSLGESNPSSKDSSFSKEIRLAYPNRFSNIKCSCKKSFYSIGSTKAKNLISKKARCANCETRFKLIK